MKFRQEKSIHKYWKVGKTYSGALEFDDCVIKILSQPREPYLSSNHIYCEIVDVTDLTSPRVLMRNSRQWFWINYLSRTPINFY